MDRHRFLISLLPISALFAQTGPCFPPFTQPLIPALPTYIVGLQTSIASIRAQCAALPQAGIQIDGQDIAAVQGTLEKGVGVPCAPYYPQLSSPPTSPCQNDNYLVQRGYMQALRNSGVQGIDINVTLFALRNSPEYVTAWNQIYPTVGGPLLTAVAGTTHFGVHVVSSTGTFHTGDTLNVTQTFGSGAGGSLTVTGCGGSGCGCGTCPPLGDSNLKVNSAGTSAYSTGAATASESGASASVSLLVAPPIGATCGMSGGLTVYLALPFPYALGPAWQANHVYSLGNTVLDPSGYLQLVTTAGTSNSSPPSTWSHNPAIPTTDGGVSWTSQGLGTVDQPPASPSFYCAELAVMDDFVAYANSLTTANGQPVKLRLAPTPGGETGASGCNLVDTGTPATNEADLERCYEPLYYAAVLRWNGASQNYAHTGPGWIDSFTTIHEPDGVWKQGLPANYTSCVSGFTTCAANVESFISHSYTNIRTAETATPPNGAGITCPTGPPSPGSNCLNIGAAIGTLSNNSQEAGFWLDWIANVPAYMDYFGQDIYANTWDPSVYASQGQWLCQATTQPLGTADLVCTAVLIPCTPAPTDINEECQWTVPSSITAQSGAVLASAAPGTLQSGSTLTNGPGTCLATFSGSVGGATAAATINSSNQVTALTMTNVGSNVIAVPGTATIGSCNSPVTGSATLNVASGAIANYATGGALSLASSLAKKAQAIPRTVRIDEANRPVYVKTGCAPTGSRGIYDNDYIEWQNDGMDIAWFQAIVGWAAANGYTSISPYATQMFNWYNSMDVNPLCVQTTVTTCPDTLLPQIPFFAQTGYMLSPGTGTNLGVATPAITQTGSAWLQTSGGTAASLQGNASLQGGTSHIGH